MKYRSFLDDQEGQSLEQGRGSAGVLGPLFLSPSLVIRSGRFRFEDYDSNEEREKAEEEEEEGTEGNGEVSVIERGKCSTRVAVRPEDLT